MMFKTLWRCSVKKTYSYKFCKIHGKAPVLECFSIKFAKKKIDFGIGVLYNLHKFFEKINTCF